MPKLSILIVNYATKGLIEKCINNLLDIYLDSEIILIDNDSPDGSGDFAENLYKDHPRVTILRSENLGQPHAYNLGLGVAKGEYIMYLGTDAFPHKGTIEAMIDYLEKNEGVGVVTPKLYTRDGSLDLDAHRGFPTPWTAMTHLLGLGKLFPKSRLFNRYFALYEDLNTRHEIDACITHCMMTRRKVHDQLGPWDEDYFIFGEDIDFFYKVKQLGYKIFYLGDVKTLHYKGATVGRDTSSDIDNVMNTDFGYATFRGEKKVSAPQDISKDKDTTPKKKMTNTVRWFRIKVTKERTRAMRLFYKKHYYNKYPKIVTMFVLFAIEVSEFIKVGKVLIKSYF